MNRILVRMLVAATVITFSMAQEKPPEKFPAEELNEAIWWPGEIQQVSDEPVGHFWLPPLFGYGTANLDQLVLSQDTILKLRKDRAIYANEIRSRLTDFDWKKPPKAPKISKQVEAIAREQLRAKGIPITNWQPQNPLALGSGMLQVIGAIDAVEVLPELLRLEEELDRLNEKARLNWGWADSPFLKKEGISSIPLIEMHTMPLWLERKSDLAKTNKDSPVMKARGRIFANSVFQQEILGVCLGIIERQRFNPLEDSFIGRLRKLTLRRAGLRNMVSLGIVDEVGLKASPAAHDYKWNSELRVPLSGKDYNQMPFSREARAEARWLIEAFIYNRDFTYRIDGAKLLDEAIVAPGDWDQMCSSGPTVPDSVPMPKGIFLLFRMDRLGENVLMRLAAYRDAVIPVLKSRLEGMKLELPPQLPTLTYPPKPRTDIHEYWPSMIQIAAGLHAIECLPELLILEQRVAEIADKAATDPQFPVPKLNMDTVSFYRDERWADRHRIQIVHREILGLIKTLLMEEGYAPMAASKVVSEQKKADERDTLTLDRAKSSGSSEKVAVWQTPPENGILGIPYTPEIRTEIRKIAEEFLKSVPPEKWKAGDAIHLPSFDKE